mgnify:CR=1 FL=1
MRQRGKEYNIRATVEGEADWVQDTERENELVNLYPQFCYQKLEGFGGADLGFLCLYRRGGESIFTGFSVAFYSFSETGSTADRCHQIYG